MQSSSVQCSALYDIVAECSAVHASVGLSGCSAGVGENPERSLVSSKLAVAVHGGPVKRSINVAL